MSVANPNYPKVSENPNRNSWNFWSSLGMDLRRVEDLSVISDTLLEAPVARYSENSFLVNRYGEEVEPEGRVSLRAARKIFGQEITEGDELVVRMLESGKTPESSDTYDASLKVEELTEEEEQMISECYQDPIMLEEIPSQMDYGKKYDFVVLHAGTDDYLVADF